jgi:hypothetical protein
MPSPFPLPPVQQLILDCAELASSLDSVDTRDHRPRVLAAVLSSRAQFNALLVRRQILSTSLVEESWVDFMFDSLRARLRSVESRIGLSAPGTRRNPWPDIDSGAPI